MVVVGGAQSSMTELSGMLGGVGLPAIVRFLSGLQKTGRLHLSQDDWSGEVEFDAGEVTGATLGSRTGLAALDGMVEMFPEAAFDFDSGTPGDNAQQPVDRTIRLESRRAAETSGRHRHAGRQRRSTPTAAGCRAKPDGRRDRG